MKSGRGMYTNNAVAPFEVVIADQALEEGDHRVESVSVLNDGCLPFTPTKSVSQPLSRSKVAPSANGGWFGPARTVVHKPFEPPKQQEDDSQPSNQTYLAQSQLHPPAQATPPVPFYQTNPAPPPLVPSSASFVFENPNAFRSFPNSKALVEQGGILWKYPFNANIQSTKPKKRWFQVTSTCLHWHDPDKSSGKQRSVLLNQSVQIVHGHQTKTFIEIPMHLLPPAQVCFSIVLTDRTLDLVASDPQEASVWVDGLRSVILGTSDTVVEEAERLPSIKTVLLSLFDACYQDNLEEFTALLEKYDIDIDMQEPGETYGDSCLIVACKFGFVKIAELCLRYGASNDPHPEYGQTALQAAVSGGHLVCAKLLLDTAAPSAMDSVIVNDADHKGNTPLHEAASRKDVFLLQLLLRHGADISLLNTHGQTVLHRVILAPLNPPPEVQRDRVRALQVLLDEGADEIVNVQDDNGNTALHFAVQSADVMLVRILLESAANPLIPNAQNFRPYHMAQSKGFRQIMGLLSEYEGWYSASTGTATTMSSTGARARQESTQVNYNTSVARHEYAEHYSEHGYPYYVNLTTGVSQWEDPRETDINCIVHPASLEEYEYYCKDGQQSSNAYSQEDSAHENTSEHYGAYHEQYVEVTETESESLKQTRRPPPKPLGAAKKTKSMGERIRAELYKAREAERQLQLIDQELCQGSEAVDSHSSPLLYSSSSLKKKSKSSSRKLDGGSRQSKATGRRNKSKSRYQEDEGFICSEDDESEYSDSSESYHHRRRSRQKNAARKTKSHKSVSSRRNSSSSVHRKSRGHSTKQSYSSESDDSQSDSDSVSSDSQDGVYSEAVRHSNGLRAKKSSKSKGMRQSGRSHSGDEVESKHSHPEIDSLTSDDEGIKCSKILVQDQPSNKQRGLSTTESEHDSKRGKRQTEEDPKIEQNEVQQTIETALDEEQYGKYIKMRHVGVGEVAVRQKMLMDGISDEAIIRQVLKVQPKPVVQQRQEQSKQPKDEDAVKVGGDIQEKKEESKASSDETAEEALKRFEAMEGAEKYMKMKRLGLPPPAIKQKMLLDGAAENLIEAFQVAFHLVPASTTASGQRMSKEDAMKKLEAHQGSEKFLKMKKMGLPAPAIKQKMLLDAASSEMIELFEIAFGLATAGPPVGLPPVEKRRGLVKLHWNPLKVQSTENTVWDTSIQVPEDELKELETIFAAKKPTTVVKAKTSKAAVKKRKSVVCSKREANVSIGLSQFKKQFPSYDMLAKAIQEADTSKLGAQKLSILLELVPTMEESKNLEAELRRTSVEKFLEDATTVEKFFLALRSVESLRNKVQGLVFLAQFAEIKKDLTKKLVTIISACAQIRSSNKLQQIFTMILSIGNFINGAESSAFSLDSLLKLRETKGSDNSSVMDYLCNLAYRKGGEELACFDQDLNDVAPASRLASTEVSKELAQAKTSLRSLEKLLQEEKSRETLFATNICQRVEAVVSEMDALIAQEQEMQTSIQQTIAYLGESESCTSKHLFTVISEFIKSFVAAREKRALRVKREARLKRMKEAKEAKETKCSE